MAARQQEKLAEKLARKMLRDAQKKGDKPETSSLTRTRLQVDPIKKKRQRVEIPVPPPFNKPVNDGSTKGSSSSNLQEDRGKGKAERVQGIPGGAGGTSEVTPG
ncbi:hypothetical protein SESBI_51128 [Sesbania bispinosa]|nr:hypothetical protein SESBI_51128 [Sesbania bispinosa]